MDEGLDSARQSSRLFTDRWGNGDCFYRLEVPGQVRPGRKMVLWYGIRCQARLPGASSRWIALGELLTDPLVDRGMRSSEAPAARAGGALACVAEFDGSGPVPSAFPWTPLYTGEYRRRLSRSGQLPPSAAELLGNPRAPRPPPRRQAVAR